MEKLCGNMRNWQEMEIPMRNKLLAMPAFTGMELRVIMIRQKYGMKRPRNREMQMQNLCWVSCIRHSAGNGIWIVHGNGIRVHLCNT